MINQLGTKVNGKNAREIIMKKYTFELILMIIIITQNAFCYEDILNIYSYNENCMHLVKKIRYSSNLLENPSFEFVSL